MRTMNATDARIHFGEVMRQVVNEQVPIVVERGGEPCVIIISVAEYERLKQIQNVQVSWQERVGQAREQIAADLGGRTLPPSEEIIRLMREERDDEILDLR